jgi:hypothetical protein
VLEKPQSVNYAEVAIWASLLVATLVAGIDRYMGSMSSSLFLATLGLYALYGVIPYKIGLGRNWPRHVVAILSIVSFAIMASGDTEGMSDLSIAFGWVATPLDFFIIYWLFKADSSAWFKQENPALKKS